jgi:Family of unknown function (DUF6282)
VTLHVENAIDLHCHFGPDTLGGNSIELGLDGRKGTPALESARAAVAAGQAGVVLKSHSFTSVVLAATLSQLFEGLSIFGGICTDESTGGLNVEAVHNALMLGAKIVWLPTMNSACDMAKDNPKGFTRPSFKGPGIAVLNDEGELVEEVQEIARMVQEHDAVLATGHITADEHYAVAKAFARRGKVLVTHAAEEVVGPNLTKAQITQLAKLGATIEFSALRCTDLFGIPGKSPVDTAELIRAAGVENCVLSTDYGFIKGAILDPVPGFRSFLERMWSEADMNEGDLTQMASRKPAELLGLA